MEKNQAPEDYSAVRRAFRKALATALKRSQRKLEKLQEEIAECEISEEFLHFGEILKANLSEVKRGMDSVVLSNPYKNGDEVLIELDPFLKPIDNARKYFKRYRKLEDGLEKKKEQLSLAETESAAISDICERFGTWSEEFSEDVPLSQAFIEEAASLRIHVEGLDSKNDERKKREGLPSGTREFVSKDGFRILVGRAARDNDRLSMKIAKGNDWWFHVAHYAGSHVVVCGTGKGTPVPRENGKGIKDSHFLPQETLLDAATLAVYFSKAREANKAEVHYTQAKHLRKGKKAPSGQVTLLQFKSVIVKMEDPRLKRLLEG